MAAGLETENFLQALLLQTEAKDTLDEVVTVGPDLANWAALVFARSTTRVTLLGPTQDTRLNVEWLSSSTRIWGRREGRQSLMSLWRQRHSTGMTPAAWYIHNDFQVMELSDQLQRDWIPDFNGASAQLYTASYDAEMSDKATGALVLSFVQRCSFKNEA